MSNTRSPGAIWVKSSYSDGGGECVEWAPFSAAVGTVPIRDSKRPGGPRLELSVHAWTVFVGGLKD
ncbi:DUF397 domain-containing protein [Streptomyces sp. NPDC001941]|uniref:DUF397 domain-containing protein n=1 Tax=Streptomyces sp. NPDC001941 TaxID=3154659 RepID=UPI00331ABA80